MGFSSRRFKTFLRRFLFLETKARADPPPCQGERTKKFQKELNIWWINPLFRLLANPLLFLEASKAETDTSRF
jgi:hypothetical protein